MKVLFTTATIEKNFDIRMNEYIRSYEHLLTNLRVREEDIFVIECVQHEPVTFLEDMSDNVFYTKTHDHKIRNKGVLETLGLMKFFDTHDIPDDQKVVKLTGRYFLESDSFLVELEKAEAVAKLDIHGQVFTGCLGMNMNLFRNFLSGLNLFEMESKMINIEREAANFLFHKKADGHQISFLEKINVVANINNDLVTYW